LEIDKNLIAAMNRWRADQTPPMDPNHAIIALLRKGLAAEGYLSGTTTTAPVQDPDAIADAFRRLLAAKRE
jgi:hypothetical protein